MAPSHIGAETQRYKLCKLCCWVLSQHRPAKIMGLPLGVPVASLCFLGSSTKYIVAKTCLPSVTPMAPRYLGCGFGIFVKNGHFRFVNPFVGGRSPTYCGVESKRRAPLKAEDESLKDNGTRYRPFHTHFSQKWRLWWSFLGKCLDVCFAYPATSKRVPIGTESGRKHIGYRALNQAHWSFLDVKECKKSIVCPLKPRWP